MILLDFNGNRLECMVMTVAFSVSIRYLDYPKAIILGHIPSNTAKSIVDALQNNRFEWLKPPDLLHFQKSRI